MLVIEKLCKKKTHSFRDFFLKRTWFWAQPVITFLVKACGIWAYTVWSVFHTHGLLFISVFSDSLSSKIPRSINRRCWILSLFQIVVHRPHLLLLCWLIGCVLPFSGEKRLKHSHFNKISWFLCLLHAREPPSRSQNSIDCYLFWTVINSKDTIKCKGWVVLENAPTWFCTFLYIFVIFLNIIHLFYSIYLWLKCFIFLRYSFAL